MTKKQIQKKHKEYKSTIKNLKNKIEQIQLQWSQLQAECEHPNSYETSTMGEAGHYCPDCGWS